MKPTKNKFYCPACSRAKMLFATKKKANNFMKFNSSAIEEQTGFCPKRSYYCIACCGWHVTSKQVYYSIKLETAVVIELFKQQNGKKEIWLRRISL